MMPVKSVFIFKVLLNFGSGEIKKCCKKIKRSNYFELLSKVKIYIFNLGDEIFSLRNISYWKNKITSP